uniref:Uncharacterized protein n=1 Tax=Tanacetum cinerariifolium TaxID=118510 RepID=A0A699HUF1_TANCI|nr:hypothetical protein [Tanacetum cinerariifolium]
MAHKQLVADVHPDELCPPNKRYDLIDANKKIDLEHVQCPSKSKFFTNIIKNHPLRFGIAASSSVPWIYMEQFWYTLKEDGSKYRLKFMLDRKELSITLDDFRTILHLPQATDNNHDSFMEHYRMYAEVFGIYVPLIQSPSTESTQGTHRTPSAPRSPTPKVDTTELKNVDDDSSIPRNDEHNILGTRLEPRSDKESPEVRITDVIVHVNFYDEEEEEDKITDEVYELKRKEKGKNVEESKITPFPTPIRSPRIHTDLELQGRYGYLFGHLKARFMPQKSFGTLANHLHDVIVESLLVMVDKHVKEQVEQQVPEQVRNQVPVYVAEGLLLERQKTKEEMEKMIAKAILQERNQEQADDFDFWTDSYALDDDEIPTKQVSQDTMEEVLLNVDEAKLKKITDEMLRQRCTSGDEHQYHIDLMKNFLKSNIVWENQKEIIVSPHPTIPFVLSC